MILADIGDVEQYVGLHPGFIEAFRFLREQADLLPAEGKHAVSGEEIFAIVSSVEGRGKKASPLEVHHAYIDIQYIREGVDIIGWKPLSRCNAPSASFDHEKDIGFYTDTPETWLELTAGTFAIFFPEDAHAPLAGKGRVSKIVLKVRVLD